MEEIRGPVEPGGINSTLFLAIEAVNVLGERETFHGNTLSPPVMEEHQGV